MSWPIRDGDRVGRGQESERLNRLGENGDKFFKALKVCENSGVCESL